MRDRKTEQLISKICSKCKDCEQCPLNHLHCSKLSGDEEEFLNALEKEGLNDKTM